MPKKTRRKKAKPKKRRVRKVSKRKKVAKKRKKPVKKLVKKAKPEKIPVSPVTNFLKRNKAEFEILPQKKSAWKPKDIAKSRKRSVGSTVKCIVLTDGKHYCCACVPGDRRIKAKKVQKALGTGKLEFARERELVKVTGQKLGTTAPIGLKKKMLVVLDKTFKKRAKVSISGGKTGFGVELRTAHLIKLAKAKVADIKQ